MTEAVRLITNKIEELKKDREILEIKEKKEEETNTYNYLLRRFKDSKYVGKIDGSSINVYKVSNIEEKEIYGGKMGIFLNLIEFHNSANNCARSMDSIPLTATGITSEQLIERKRLGSDEYDTYYFNITEEEFYDHKIFAKKREKSFKEFYKMNNKLKGKYER